MIHPASFHRGDSGITGFHPAAKAIAGDATSERNRVQKILEDANVKLGDELSDVFGASGN